jgi:uncharacterized protein (UPF0276 family)
LREFTERHPLVCHGLSLRWVGPAPLDEALLGRFIRAFMDENGIASLLTEHLAWCAAIAKVYELCTFAEPAMRYAGPGTHPRARTCSAGRGIENRELLTSKPVRRG